MSCTLCAQRVTAPGMRSYCADGVQSRLDGPGKLIPPQHIAAAPAWCPKRETSA